MADFPSKVSTETSSSYSQNTQQRGTSFQGLAANVTSTVDVTFVRSIPGILMITESVLGLLQWALIASTPHTRVPASGWVLFVSITLWILTSVLFSIILFGVHKRLTAIPWLLMVMGYHGVATVLCFTAFVANAASVNAFNKHLFNTYHGHMAAAAFFGAASTVAYGASAFFSYLDWRGDRGNAATTTVPT